MSGNFAPAKADRELQGLITASRSTAGWVGSVTVVSERGVNHTWSGCPRMKIVEVENLLGERGPYKLFDVRADKVFDLPQCASCGDALASGSGNAENLREQTRPATSYHLWSRGEVPLGVAIRDCSPTRIISRSHVARMLKMLQKSPRHKEGEVAMQVERATIPDDLAGALEGGTHLSGGVSIITTDTMTSRRIARIAPPHTARSMREVGCNKILGAAGEDPEASADMYVRMLGSWQGSIPELWEVAAGLAA